MLLGIDVGGTFTDAVVVGEEGILAQAKVPTTHGELLAGILAVMDEALVGLEPGALTRVALSTTIVTNTVVEGKTDPVALFLLPGPGLDLAGLIPDTPFILTGYIDHRGRETAAPIEAEVREACQSSGRALCAVAGKFAVRNPKHELSVAAWLRKYTKPEHITLGSAVSGGLNYWRRVNSAYYNSAVWRTFGRFAHSAEEAVRTRGISAPLYILKADGGTIPLMAARELPVEAVFTGPAASVLGVMALAAPSGEAISLDIGGTTTDIALWRDGVPLFAERGAKVNGYPTAVRSFWLHSVGVGGDSYVRREEGKITVGPERRGPAMASGGSAPTVSDAMIVAGVATFGDAGKAAEAMGRLAIPGQELYAVAEEVLDAAAEKICHAISTMIEERAAEPVYRVEDIIRGIRLQPKAVIGVGGAASGLAPIVARKLKLSCLVPEGATVANAIGAALARPTLEITLRVDTEQGYYTVAELGLRNHLPSRRLTLADAEKIAAQHLADRAGKAGIPVTDTETIAAEEFNLVRGFSTTGKIITCRLQIKPGVTPIGSEGGDW